jgi:hypothetical protein
MNINIQVYSYVQARKGTAVQTTHVLFKEVRPMWHSLVLQFLWEKCKVVSLMAVSEAFCGRYFSIQAFEQDNATTQGGPTIESACNQP